MNSVPRWPTAVLFAAAGAAFGSWIPFVPRVAERLSLSDTQIGMTLGVVALGAAPAMPAAGWLIERAGLARVASLAAAVLMPALALPLRVSTFTALLINALAMGLAYGALDVTMNASAVALERRCGRVLMSFMHGCFSLGVFSGAGGAALMMWIGVTPATTMTAWAGLLSLLLFVATRQLDPAPPPAAAGTLARPTRALAALGLMATLAMALESGIESWSTVWLTRAGSSDSIAALTFATYAAGATALRFAGDAMVRRWGRRQVFTVSGLVATAALMAALNSGSGWWQLAAFAAAGAGTGNLVPILFAMAGNVGGRAPAAAIGWVAAAGYTGLLTAPPAVGWMASVIGLDSSLQIIASIGALCAIAAILIL